MPPATQEHLVPQQQPTQQEQQPMPQQPLQEPGFQQQDDQQVLRQPIPEPEIPLVEIPQQVQNPAADEPNKCAFCLQDLGDLPVEALLCGHVFHTACVEDYLSATNRDRNTCRCPFKCHVQGFIEIADPAEPSDAVAVAPLPADVLQLAELARENAQAETY